MATDYDSITNNGGRMQTKSIVITAKTSTMSVIELVHQLKLAGFDVVRWVFRDGNVMLEGVKSAA